MIFIDTNVFMYSVGRAHPLREPAREFFVDSVRDQLRLYTSAEVLQELAYSYLPVNRRQTLEAAISLIIRTGVEVWPLESEDVYLACQLHEQFPALGARDLCHFASCQRRGVTRIKTFDQAFAAAANTMGS